MDDFFLIFCNLFLPGRSKRQKNQKGGKNNAKKEDITLVSPCGGYCGDCPAYKVKDDPSLADALKKKVNWNGIPCEGCRPLKGKCQFVDGICETYACISKRGHDFCFECAVKAGVLPLPVVLIGNRV